MEPIMTQVTLALFEFSKMLTICMLPFIFLTTMLFSTNSLKRQKYIFLKFANHLSIPAGAALGLLVVISVGFIEGPIFSSPISETPIDFLRTICYYLILFVSSFILCLLSMKICILLNERK